MSKTSKFRYEGSPGYEFTFESGARVLFSGDVVELTAEEAASVGPDQFTPAGKATNPAPAADPEES